MKRNEGKQWGGAPWRRGKAPRGGAGGGLATRRPCILGSAQPRWSCPSASRGPSSGGPHAAAALTQESIDAAALLH